MSHESVLGIRGETLREREREREGGRERETEGGKPRLKNEQNQTRVVQTNLIFGTLNQLFTQHFEVHSQAHWVLAGFCQGQYIATIMFSYKCSDLLFYSLIHYQYGHM